MCAPSLCTLATRDLPATGTRRSHTSLHVSRSNAHDFHATRRRSGQRTPLARAGPRSPDPRPHPGPPAQRSLALGLLKFTHRTVLRVAVPYVPRTSTLYVRASNKCSRTVEVRRVETSTLYLPPRAPSALSAPRPCPPCTTEGVGARTQSQTQRHTRHSEHGSRSRVSGEGVPSVF